MAGQPPQGPEDDFLDQFFSLTSSLSAGGRSSGDQPFSLDLSLDAAADASGMRGSIGDDADKGVSALSTFPFIFFGFCAGSRPRVLLRVTFTARLCRSGAPCSFPASSRRRSAVACSRRTFAPAILPRYPFADKSYAFQFRICRIFY